MLTEWITSIILFILLATVVEMLLPNSAMQKYTKLVIGLLLIVVVLSPILKLFSTDIDELFAKMATMPSYSSEEITENLIEMKKKEIQASHAAYILDRWAVLMKDDVEGELRETYGLSVKNLNIVVKNEEQLTTMPLEENIESVEILLGAPDEETAISVIKPVHIDTSRPDEAASSTKEEKKVVNFLADRWHLQPTTISVAVEGGD
ncbi:stage III sporulation protein AF [Bacillus sp. THAF10]|uniref:stage III sporulation protein AF n=1 Tax=Bacillus sp. THAF10 TaxID=2587848 RepID=UPI0020A62A9B|nr:stage III sporulation protein AF [Bacillus sp. THAF10]